MYYRIVHKLIFILSELNDDEMMTVSLSA